MRCLQFASVAHIPLSIPLFVVQELLTLPERLSLSPVFSEVHVAQLLSGMFYLFFIL